MTASNRDIAIEYLDSEVHNNVAYVKALIRKALNKEYRTEEAFNIISLEVDPKAQTVTLHQDLFDYQPETFSAEEFLTWLAPVALDERMRRAKSLWTMLKR
ncbi:hypothetical protein [Pseudophaeobacter sp.]|uniref:hypothetical protein n=1 Tax=Pseudophaeobacter sp. TaxID=1971739 RepID=UPI0032988347